MSADSEAAKAAGCTSPDAKPLKYEETSTSVRERIRSPGDFQEDSFRTIETGDHKRVIGRPKGKETTETQAVIHPLSEKDMLKNRARSQDVPFAQSSGVEAEGEPSMPFKAEASAYHLAWNMPIRADSQLTQPGKLIIAGEALDGSENENGWALDEVERESVAGQLQGAQLRIDHSKSVRDIVGQVHRGVHDKATTKVHFEAELTDAPIQDKVQRGYVRHVSIGADGREVRCSACSKQYLRGADGTPIKPCQCKDARGMVKGVQLNELSIVATPAYRSAEFAPIGFAASMNEAMKRAMKSSVNPDMPVPKTELINHESAISRSGGRMPTNAESDADAKKPPVKADSDSESAVPPPVPPKKPAPPAGGEPTEDEADSKRLRAEMDAMAKKMKAMEAEMAILKSEAAEAARKVPAEASRQGGRSEPGAVEASMAGDKVINDPYGRPLSIQASIKAHMFEMGPRLNIPKEQIEELYRGR